MIRLLPFFSLFFVLILPALAEDETKRPRYREGKKIDFESLLIEGQKKKADYSVVTGNLGENDFGLLKLRENFTDTMADDIGEEVQ